MKRSTIVILIVFAVLILDQALKIWVKMHMEYGQEFGILGLTWARIHFVENEGMAFGITLGGTAGKLVLSLFRIIAVVFLIYIIRTLIKAKESKGLLVCFGLILAGAIGNILDSAFYGMIFSESRYHGTVAEIFPEGGGYASFLFGKVVDMLYFPMINTYLPEWVPFWGGERFQFFNPVFNIADAAISTGVISLIVFHRKFLRSAGKETESTVISATETQVMDASSGEEE